MKQFTRLLRDNRYTGILYYNRRFFNCLGWGKQLTFYGVKTKKLIRYGNKVLNGSLIYFDEQRTFEPLYKAEKIWGLTGNVFFLKNTVIIDYKNKLFGVL